jgi:hypothetical protein
MRSSLFPIPARIYCAAIGVLLAVATAVFVLLPYALESHPGEARPIATSTADRHAT